MEHIHHITDDLRKECLRYAKRLLEDEHTAEDILQEAELKLYQQQEPIKNPRAFLYNGIRFASWDAIRKRNAEMRALGSRPHGEEITYECPRVISERYEQTTAIAHAVNLLPQEIRSSITAQFYQGMPRQDIAEMHQISLGGAKARLAKGKESLRNTLIDYRDEFRL